MIAHSLLTGKPMQIHDTPTREFEFLPVNKYLQVILTNDRTVVRGNVITHLSLEDWCEMRGYRIFRSGTHLYAAPWDKTHLIEPTLPNYLQACKVPS